MIPLPSKSDRPVVTDEEITFLREVVQKFRAGTDPSTLNRIRVQDIANRLKMQLAWDNAEARRVPSKGTLWNKYPLPTVCPR